MMSDRQDSINGLRHAEQELCDDDLREVQVYADYLIAKRLKQESHVHVNELIGQHKESTRLLFTYILQRSRLISMVNHLANIIIQSETISNQHRCEAQEAMKNANWILQGDISPTEEKS